MLIERRKFLESACKACLLAGAGVLISELTACSPSFQVVNLPVTDNAVHLPLSSFSDKAMQLVRPQGWFYDIAVRKLSADQYEALLLECTHQKNQLMVTGKTFFCTLHGSRFDMNGSVLKGPAERPLKKYTTSQSGDQLVIQINS